MKRIAHAVLILSAVAGLCGCSAVYTQEPFGQAPLDLARERDEWEGTWAHNDGMVSVSVQDASNGVLEIGWIESNSDGMKLLKGEVLLRTVDGALFASLKMKEADEADSAKGYLWGRMQRRKNTVLVWGPDKAEFERRVEQGALPGATNGSDLVLGPLATNQLSAIARDDGLFEWKEPLVFWKTAEAAR